MSSDSPTDFPSSYEELFEQYFDYVKGLVAKLGIRENEDVASEILVRFFARDFLNEYDPTVTVTHGGEVKRTSFKAFLRAFVERYSRHYRERQGVRDGREPLVCDKPLPSGQLWIDVYSRPVDPISTSDLEVEELVLLIRGRLEELPVRGKRDYPKLFDLVVPMVRTEGKIDRRALSEQYGVSATVISDMLRVMRESLSYLSPSAA